MIKLKSKNAPSFKTKLNNTIVMTIIKDSFTVPLSREREGVLEGDFLQTFHMFCIFFFVVNSHHVPSTYFQSEISQNRPVRFIYRGRVLSEDTLTLEQLEMGNQGVIHFHIGRPQPTEAHEENRQEIEMLDLECPSFLSLG